MSKYVYATYFTPDTDPQSTEITDYDGYIAIVPADDFHCDGVDDDDLWAALPSLSTDPICSEDETHYSIPKGGMAAAIAYLAACPLVSHSSDFQEFCRGYSGCYGWKAD
jgi:hypothetical protein